MSTPVGGLVSRGSALGLKHSRGALKSRATWAPGTAPQGQGLGRKPSLQPDSLDSLVPRKSAKVGVQSFGTVSRFSECRSCLQ